MSRWPEGWTLRREIVDAIDRERAERIRYWRSECCGTWAMIASAYARAYEAPGVWGGLMGEDLCHAAARVLGEDPHKMPWNDS
jgi:hypothetical protein